MPKSVKNITIVCYGLILLYATSLVIYAGAIRFYPFQANAINMSLMYLILLICTIGTLKLKNTFRRLLVFSNIVMMVYGVLLWQVAPDFIQPGYVLMNFIIAVYFSQARIAVMFSPGRRITDRKSILIVDDEEAVIKTLKGILLSQGFSVLTAGSGEKGMQVARLQQPDLIILDVLLPGMKGRETCVRLKEDSATKDIPVIFLTAKDSPDDIRAEKEAGAVSHLTKPVNAKQLVAEVKACIGV